MLPWQILLALLLALLEGAHLPYGFAMLLIMPSWTRFPLRSTR